MLKKIIPVLIIAAVLTSCKKTFEKKTLLFPCVPFEEDLKYKYYDADSPDDTTGEKNPANVTFYALDEIPDGYIALPVKKGEQIFYPSSDDYPLYRSEKVICKIQPETETYGTIFFASVGDIILNRGVAEVLLENDSAEAVFADTMNLLVNSDYTIGNLEGAVTEHDIPWPKTYRFKFKREVLHYLHDAGFDYLMLTNNHCYDYNEKGFVDTLTAVREENFATSGAGYTYFDAANFYRTQIKETGVSILSFGAFPTERTGFDGLIHASATDTRAGILWQSDEVIKLIEEEKNNNPDNIIIINIHGGYEYSLKPADDQIELYKKVCDAGADIVLGSHPHVLQPVEMYDNSLIVYSQGNFIFPGMDDMPNATDTMVVRVGFIKNRPLYFEKHLATIVDTKTILQDIQNKD